MYHTHTQNAGMNSAQGEEKQPPNEMINERNLIGVITSHLIQGCHYEPINYVKNTVSPRPRQYLKHVIIPKLRNILITKAIQQHVACCI